MIITDALKLCLRDLGPRRRAVFDGLDFHLPDSDSEPSSADRIEIEVTFSDLPDEEWDDELVGRLNRARVLQIDDEERNHVRLRVTCKYDRGSREFGQEWSFLDLQGDPLSRAGPRALTVLQDEIRYHYLTALRAAARHFDAKGHPVTLATGSSTRPTYPIAPRPELPPKLPSRWKIVVPLACPPRSATC